MQRNEMQGKNAIHAFVVRVIVEAIEDEAFDEQDNEERSALHLADIRIILYARRTRLCHCPHILSNWQ